MTRAVMRGARGIGSRHACAERVCDVLLPEEDRGGKALGVERVDDLAVPLAPHAGEIQIVAHSGSLYAAIAFSPRMLR